MKHLIVITILFTFILASCQSRQEQNISDDFYHNQEIENSDIYKNCNDYQKDFLLAIDLLRTTHPAFAPQRIPPFDLDSVQNAGMYFLKECNDIEHFRQYLTTVTAKLGDEHTYISVLTSIDKNDLYYFVQLNINNSDIKLKVIPKEFIEHLEKNIVKINGYSALDVINSFKDYINSDNDYLIYRQINGYMQFFSIWKTNKYFSADSILSLTFSDGNTIKIKPQPLAEVMKIKDEFKTSQQSIIDNIKWHPITKPQTEKLFFYTVLDKESICYFQFNQCIDNSTLRWQDYMSGKHTADSILDKTLSQFPRFDSLVAQMFNEIKEKNIKTLVVDVRHNGGGDSKLCEILLSYCKPYKDIAKGETYVRISPLFKKRYPESYTQILKAMHERNIDFKMGEIYRAKDLNTEESKPENEQFMNKYFQYNEDINNIFKGNIIFMQSKRTFSSAGLLITTACDNKIGTVIGDKSVYKPCSYGDILTWQLPNTKISGGVSYKIFNRANEDKCNEKYLVPNVVIENTNEDVMQGKDKCWNWVIENYAK
jgi:hypothetical protein